MSADGKAAYEADVARRPLYHDGKPRKTWDQLGQVEQSSWDQVVPWRIFINKKLSHTTYALTAEDAIRAENVRLGAKAADVHIMAQSVNSASD